MQITRKISRPRLNRSFYIKFKIFSRSCIVSRTCLFNCRKYFLFNIFKLCKLCRNSVRYIYFSYDIRLQLLCVGSRCLTCWSGWVRDPTAVHSVRRSSILPRATLQKQAFQRPGRSSDHSLPELYSAFFGVPSPCLYLCEFYRTLPHATCDHRQCCGFGIALI